MQVILKQEVDGLGTIGDVVKVKDGYGRNYLIPRGLAIAANEKNLKVIEGEKKRLAKVRANSVSLAESLKSQLDGVQLSFTKQAGNDGKLFGSVTGAEIATALDEKGFKIEKRKISVEHINHLGDYEVKIKLFQDIVGTIKINVTSPN